MDKKLKNKGQDNSSFLTHNSSFIRILLIEDNPGDARLIEEMLREANIQFELKCVDRLSAGIGQIKLDGFDVILLDLGLPESQGLGTLMKLNEIKPEAPVIVLTGLADEAVGIQAVKEGAQDYLIKGQVDKNLLARSINYAIERKKAIDALRESESRLRTISNNLVYGMIYQIVVLEDGSRKFTYLSDNVKRFYGVTPQEAMADAGLIYGRVHDDDKARIFREEEQARKTLSVFQTEARMIRPDGGIRWSYFVSRPRLLADGGSCWDGIEFDVTEKRKLEDQLRHSQKMEAIGTLAGGIAHDFNNILNVIIGYGSLLEMKMGPEDPLRLNVDNILESAERAATLTHSLLAFSRKQIIEMRPVELNELIKRVERFLTRIIGEDVELGIKLCEKALSVMADSGQLEQVLLNLATNARDAMPHGGLLSLETAPVELNGEFIRAHGYGETGNYALITVTDTGVGMDGPTLKRIFEPFFTTKEIGKGTGLGLSIVYGIIKQHNGYINVYSEPGLGTTFKIYLPSVKSGSGEEKLPTGLSSPLPLGTETVLIAEDDESLRKLSRIVLETFGYKVITAEDGEAAIRMFQENKAEIRLVILDLIMPGKSGREVYNAIRETRPDMKALFMSGYTVDKIYREGYLEEGLDFIPKPVSPRDLLRKVREVLDKQT